jgi:hypothetical protein
LESLPQEFSIDELVDRLLFIEKVEQAEKQSSNGEVIAHEDIDEEINK